jgi:hypothetical protein
MHVFVSGASGLIGSALVPALVETGHRVTRLVRREPADDAEARWDPESGTVDTARLEGVNAVVHLAGKTIAGRWTARVKETLRNSRVDGTRALCDALPRMTRRPEVLVSASAVGFYGDRGCKVLTENSPPGTGFLADVCREWEEATAPAAGAGIRVVNLRIGMVLARSGGALAAMLLPFRMGLGGPIGDGRQYVSWVSLDDVVGAILHTLTLATIAGPVNATAPHPVTNGEFTRTLAHVLHRPALLRAPAFAARLAFGEMADALLLASARVEPQRLLETGYTFRHPELERALRAILTAM